MRSAHKLAKPIDDAEDKEAGYALAPLGSAIYALRAESKGLKDVSSSRCPKGNSEAGRKAKT